MSHRPTNSLNSSRGSIGGLDETREGPLPLKKGVKHVIANLNDELDQASDNTRRTANFGKTM